MKKLKIAVFTDTFFPHINGVVSAIYNSTKGLQGLGHEVMLFAPKSLLKNKTAVQYPNLNAEIVYLPSIPVVDRGLRLSFPFFPITIIKMLKFNPDIIHFHMPLTLGMEAILTAKILEKPLIATFHTFFMEEEYLKKARINNKHAEKVFSKIGWEYSKLYYNQSDIIITPSKYTAANIQKNGCTKPVAIIPNSIEITRSHPPVSPAEREKLRIKFGIPPGNKVIIWLGRLSPEKKLDVALAAVKVLLNRASNVTFLLIGDGPQRGHLEKIASKEILKKNVIFTGTIEHKLLIAQRLLAVGDVFFSASTSETQCISAIEAMAEGLPLAVADKRGLPELVQGNGFICTAGNPQDMAGKLYTILTDEKLRLKMSAKSHELSLNYSNEIIAKKLTELYEKVINSRQSPNTNNVKNVVLPEQF